MAFVVLAAFLVVVAIAAWLSSRAGVSSTGCCAPADPRDDLRMRPHARHLDDGSA